MVLMILLRPRAGDGVEAGSGAVEIGDHWPQALKTPSVSTPVEAPALTYGASQLTAVVPLGRQRLHPPGPRGSLQLLPREWVI